MKTYNIEYTELLELERFIDTKQNLCSCKNILIQIFSGSTCITILEDIVTFLNHKLPQSKIIGATTDGEIYGNNVSAQKIVVSISCFSSTTIELSYDSSEDSFIRGKNLIQNIKRENSKLFILFADGLHTNGEEFLKGANEYCDEEIISGGLAGDNAKFQNTYVVAGDKIIQNGAVGVSLSGEKLRVHNDFSFAWNPIGKEFLVEKSVKNRVYKVGGTTPFELYKRYLGKSVSKQLPGVGIEFPFVIERGGILTARAVLEVHNDGSLTFAGNVEEGSIVRFAIGDAEAILEKSLCIYNKIIEYSPESIFIYSCMARRRFLDSKAKLEINNFLNIAPTAGFFTYGEFFRDSEKTNFLNETMTVVTLSEEADIRSNLKKLTKKREVLEEVTTIGAMSHILKETSKEIQDLTFNLEEKVEEQTSLLKEKNLELEFKLYHDELTGLRNRQAVIEKIHADNVTGLILIDINSFSSINDIYGEEVGNVVLEKFAQFLLNASNGRFLVCRFNADQFVLLNTVFFDTRICKKFAEELIDEVEKKSFSVLVEGFNLEISINITVSIVNNIESSHILENADMALRHAKHHKKHLVIYNKELNLEEHYKQDIETTKLVKKAIKEDRVIPFFQPIIRESGVKSYECLMRIQQEDNFISPAKFLGVIKKTRYYSQLTKIMIRKSFEYFKDRDEHFSINFSFEDIVNKETVTYLIRSIHEYGISNRLIIEIVESESLENFDLVNEFLKTLRDFNVQIAIDDFGSGYSNFSYLLELKPDFIKIDGSLIKSIDTDEKSYLITKTIVNFSKDMNIKTVAEYIHNQEVFDRAKDLHIDGFQGFFLGKPQVRI